MWRRLARKARGLAARVGDFALAVVFVFSGRRSPPEAPPAPARLGTADPFRAYLSGRPVEPPVPHNVVGRVRQLMDRAQLRRSAREKRIEEAALRLTTICHLIETYRPIRDETAPRLPETYGDELYGIWREVEVWRAQGRFSAFARLGGRRREEFDHDSVVAALGVRVAAELQACLDGETTGLASGPYHRLERALTARRWLRSAFGRRPETKGEERSSGDDLFQP